MVRAYHERTKHHLNRYAQGPYGLDWANQPDPFRRYAGAELIRLPRFDPAEDEAGPALAEARVEGAIAPAPLDAPALGRFLFDSLALSAWKELGGNRWALRVNPSSGNLHPTEAYVVAGPVAGLAGDDDRGTVWHYAPREHGLELLARVPHAAWAELGLGADAFLVAMTSVHWREAWKYGERAFRYCNHDAGHAVAALGYAAGALGWSARLVEGVGHDALARLVGVHRQEGPEAEHPEALVVVRPGAPPGSAGPTIGAEPLAGVSWAGRPNRLSPEHVEWEAIDVVAEATRAPRGASLDPWEPPSGPALAGATPARAVLRRRRSAVAMDGETGLGREAFFGMLAATMPAAGRVPTAALPWSPRAHLAVFVHRVEGVVPGLYWLARDPARAEAARAACREDLLWEPVGGTDLPLFLLLPLDLRRASAQVSCHQDIAADGAFSLGMIADLERSLAAGAWTYPRLYWETGVVGQVLYLEAEAAGARATGIGCFFDDAMHALLGFRDRAWQSLYHFTVGGAVDDPRLTTLPAYQA